MRQKRSVLIAAALALLLILALSACQAKNNNVKVDIFYLPHAPAEAVISKVDKVLANYKGLDVRKLNFEDAQNSDLIKQYGIVEHMPVAIFINGKNKFKIGNREVVFRNFPAGDTFTPMGLGGNWNYQDLDTILKREVKANSKSG